MKWRTNKNDFSAVAFVAFELKPFAAAESFP